MLGPLFSWAFRIQIIGKDPNLFLCLYLYLEQNWVGLAQDKLFFSFKSFQNDHSLFIKTKWYLQKKKAFLNPLFKKWITYAIKESRPLSELTKECGTLNSYIASFMI